MDIDFDAGIVYVDGLALDEPYINMPTHASSTCDFPQTVPKGSVFVMGTTAAIRWTAARPVWA